MARGASVTLREGTAELMLLLRELGVRQERTGLSDAIQKLYQYPLVGACMLQAPPLSPARLRVFHVRLINAFDLDAHLGSGLPLMPPLAI